MATLRAKHKQFLIKHLAEFVPPGEVRARFEDKYGFEVSSSQVAYYDPTTSRGAELSEKWTRLFHDTREAFKKDYQRIPIANKAVRFREYQAMLVKLRGLVRQLEGMKNVLGAAGLLEQIQDLLEQAAKEEGGMFTNRRLLEMMGEGGGPIETRNANVDLTDTDDPKELMRRYEELFADE